MEHAGESSLLQLIDTLVREKQGRMFSDHG
jgi:hypothetical protein